MDRSTTSHSEDPETPSTSPGDFPGTAWTLPVKIDADIEPRITYALAHNGFSVIRNLTVTNESSVSIVDLTVDVSITAILDRPIAPTAEYQIDSLGARQSHPKRDLPLRLDPLAMAQVDDLMPAEVTVTVRSGDRRATKRFPVELLAYSQWVHQSGVLFDVLPAFVMPNHPAVAGVMRRASDILLKGTGSGSIEGYQSGSERALLIAGALFDALVGSDVRYADPPASYSERQRVRTPEEVVDGRLGTCLDLAVTYAACLEQAGLHPVLFLVPGHAFTGFFTNGDYMLRESVAYETGDIDNLVQSGAIVPVETVRFTEDSTFAEAVEAGMQNVTDSRNALKRQSPSDRRAVRIDAVIDVRRSRGDGIKPIPAREHDEGGQIVVHVFEDPDSSVAVGRTTESDAVDASELGGTREVEKLGRDDAPLRIRRWKASLLDLSLRNALLNFTERKSAMDLILSADAISDLEDRLHSDEHIEVRPLTVIPDVDRGRGADSALDLDPDTRDNLLAADNAVYVMTGTREGILGDPQAYKKRFRALQRKARRLEEETGSNNLFLVLGTLKWSMTPDREVNPNRDNAAFMANQQELRSPIYLVPIRIEPSGGGRSFSIRLEEGGFSTPNHCLAEKLRQEFDLDIPDLTEPVLDDAGIDLEAAFQSIREQLLDQEYNFLVDPTAHIAFLDFTTFRLWRDLDLHWRDFMQNSVVRHLVETPNNVYEDPAKDGDEEEADALDLLCPVPFDGSQMQAIAAAAAGRSFVLEGPPGTGKSQTIANLLANAIATGKKVLFVAEKQAALSIVKDRLDQVGLGSLCLDLHSKGSTTKQIRQQLKESLGLTVNRDEPGWDSARRRRSASAASLRRYPSALHAENTAGYSAWTGHQYSLELGEGISADVSIRILDLPEEEIEMMKRSLEELPEVAGAVGPPNGHPWSLSNATDSDQMDRANLSLAIDRLHDDLPTVAQRSDLSRLLHAPDAGAMLRDLAHVVDVLHRERQVSPRLVREVTASEWGWDRDEFVSRSKEFVELHGGAFETFSPDILRSDTAVLVAAAREIGEASWIKRRSLRKQLVADLEPHLRDAAVLPKDLEPLLVPVDDAQQEFANLVSHLDGLSGLDAAVWNPLIESSQADLDDRLEFLEALRRCAGDGNGSLDALEDLFSNPGSLSEKLGDALNNIADAWESLSVILELSDDSVFRWMNGSDWLTAVDGTVDKWQSDSHGDRFLQLQRWSAFVAQLELLRTDDLDGFRSAILSGEIASEDAGESFQRGLVDISNQERFVSEALDRFDAAEHERRIKVFGEADRALRALMVTEIPGRMLDGRPFNSLHKRGEVGDLTGELTRVRGGASIRELLKRHPRMVLELMPCFLMSPESVARFLDTDGITFDMVVFDEASQIRVAQAIGALGRARSAVIVGDSRQMPPTTFGLAGMSFDDDANDDEELLVPLDLESILSEAVESQIPRMWLSWHYRSQAEELIAFSNTHYYDQRLASFPSPELARSGYGLDWRRIDGEFLRGRGRVNREEAQAIVDEVKGRVATDPDASLGIVTLNIEQMNLVEDLLRELKVPEIDALLEAPDGLFVKNLESVQGDERDVILLSVAFSRDRNSGKFPMNFGPLNRDGGERRLNVAVTRARRQVVVFCSFDPEDIDLARTSSVGVRHLRDYLFMVRDGANSDGQAVSARGRRKDRHRSDIAEKLRSRGLRVGVDVGLSEFKVDLAVGLPDEPDQWTLAILLDGPDWAERHTIHDRDCLPTVVLGGLLGWPRVARVWLPSWLAEQDHVLDDLEELARTVPEEDDPDDVGDTEDDSIDEAREADGEGDLLGTGDHDLSDTPEVVDDHTVSLAADGSPQPSAVKIGMPGFVPYPDEPLLGTRDELDMLRHPAIARRVRAAMDDAIAQEGPVQLGRLTKMVANRFDLHRVRRSRSEQLARLVDPYLIESDALGQFVWPGDMDPDIWRGFRPSEEHPYRDMDEIDHREMTNAMEHTVRATFSIEPEELMRETAAIFGVSRLGTKVRSRLEAVLEWAIVQNRLVEADGRIRLPDGDD